MLRSQADLCSSCWWSAEDWPGKARQHSYYTQAGAGWRWTPTQTCQLTTQTGVEEQNILSQSLIYRRLSNLYFNFSKFRLRPKTFQSLKYHLIINCCLLQWETCEATDAATPQISHFSGNTWDGRQMSDMYNPNLILYYYHYYTKYYIYSPRHQ